MTFIGAKLVLHCEGALLSCLRDDYDWIPFPGHWDLPGGGAEPGETPLACALRELGEEFGIAVDPARLTGHVFHNAGGPSWLFCGAITRAQIAAIRFGDEGQEWCMMPIADYIAHPLAVPHFRPRVAQVMGL